MYKDNRHRKAGTLQHALAELEKVKETPEKQAGVDKLISELRKVQ